MKNIILLKPNVNNFLCLLTHCTSDLNKSQTKINTFFLLVSENYSRKGGEETESFFYICYHVKRIF